MNPTDREDVLLRALKFQIDEVESEEHISELTRRENIQLRAKAEKLHEELTAAIAFAREVARDLMILEAGARQGGNLMDCVEHYARDTRMELAALVRAQERLRGAGEWTTAYQMARCTVPLVCYDEFANCTKQEQRPAKGST